jgi:hypothetical protein
MKNFWLMRKILMSSTAMITIMTLEACKTDGADIDTAIKNTVPAACATGHVADAGFKSYAAASGKVKQKYIDAENAALDHLNNICDNPANQNAVGALTEVLSATGDIVGALRSAKIGA